MKKINALIICIVICLTFFGCSHSDSVQQNDSTSEQITYATESQTVQSQTQESKTSETENQTSTTLQNTTTTATATTSATTTKSSESTTEKVTTSAKKTTTKKTTTKSAGKTTTKSSQNTASAKKTTATATTATTSAQEITCTVKIDCSSILDNLDDLKSGHENYVPSNGVILSTASVTVKEGASVYDAVKSACSSAGISINVQSSVYGKYIAGFNNIDEKDCGSQSGWTYTVNGSYPSKSCDKYILSNGDKVEFIFTCSY